MKFCTKCGASLEDKALFCTKCGTSMKEDVKKEPEIITPVPETDSEPAKASAQEIVSEPEPVATSNNSTTVTPPPTPASALQPEQTPAPAPKPAISAEKKQPSGIPVKILSIFLSFIFCVILTATSTLGIVRNSLHPDSIADAVSSIVVDDIEDITVVDDDGNDVPLSKYILDFCDEDVKNKYDLDEDKVIKVIKDTKADEFLGEVIADYSAYLINGEELQELDADRIITWIRDNETAIENVVEYEFKEDDYKELEEELSNSDFIKILSEDELEKELEGELDVDVSMVQRGLSIWIYIILIVLVCAVAALVVAINRKKFRALFTYVTVSLAVVGSIFLLMTGGLFIVMEVLLPEIINAVIGTFVMATLIRGAVMFGVGLIASIVYKIVSDRRRVKA